MATTIEAGRGVTYDALRRFVATEGDAVKEVTMAKLATQRACFDVMDTCLQIHGGAGYMKEYDIERMARDARLGPIGGGTDEIMREILARCWRSKHTRPMSVAALAALAGPSRAPCTGSRRRPRASSRTRSGRRPSAARPCACTAPAAPRRRVCGWATASASGCGRCRCRSPRAARVTMRKMAPAQRGAPGCSSPATTVTSFARAARVTRVEAALG